MCSCNQPRPNNPPWHRTVGNFAVRNRDTLRGVAALAVLLAALAGVLFYQFGPTDIERAEADLLKAHVVVTALIYESGDCLKDAKEHKLCAAELRKLLDERSDSADAEWLGWHRSMAESHSQLHRAKRARRDSLLHLTAGYLRLLAEAESEILRAKDARDRGTPYKVAPRVRDLLAPVLSGR